MVQKIDFHGTERPVLFNFNALADFADMRGKSMDDMLRFGDMNAADVRALIWAGLKEGARKSNEKFEGTIEDVGEWMGADADLVARVMDVFTSQMAAPVEGK